MPVQTLVFVSAGDVMFVDGDGEVPLCLSREGSLTMKGLGLRLKKELPPGEVFVMSGSGYSVMQSAEIISQELGLPLGDIASHHELQPPAEGGTDDAQPGVNIILRECRSRTGTLVVVTGGAYTSTLPRLCFRELKVLDRFHFMLALLGPGKAYVVNLRGESTIKKIAP